MGPARSRLIAIHYPSFRTVGVDLLKLEAGQARGEFRIVAVRVVFREHEHMEREVFRDEAAPEALDAGSPNRRVVVGRSEAASTCEKVSA